MLKRIFYTMTFVALALGVSAQDVHYSQFFNSPLNLNPGLTGVFNGNQRYHLNFKNQWNNPVGYNSFDLGADFKFDKCSTKRSHLNLGALVNFDRAGDLKLQAAGLNLFASYTIGLSDYLSLTPGLNAGFVSRSYDWTDADWIKLTGGVQTPESINTSTSYFDLNGGVNLRYQKTYRKTLDFGAGLFHLNSPDVQFASIANDIVELEQKLNLYAMFNWPLADKLDIVLNGLYSSQKVYQEVVLNAQGKIYLGDSYSKALYLGIGARLADINGDPANNGETGTLGLESIHPIIGLQLGNLKAELNFDVTTSPFSHAAKGGPELSLMYNVYCIPPEVCKPCPIY